MRSNLCAAALAANAAFVFASPTSVSEPCAQVSAQLAANPPTDQYGNPIVDIDTAYVSRCMFKYSNLSDHTRLVSSPFQLPNLLIYSN
jgi:hypothetical protein